MPEREFADRVHPAAPPRSVASRPAHPVLALQRTAGNRAVQRFLAADGQRAALETYIVGNAARIVAAARPAVAKEQRVDTVEPAAVWAHFETSEPNDAFISKLLSSVVRSGRLPSAGPAPESMLRRAVRRLNAIEEKARTHTVQQADPGTIMYGTEFTFTKPDLAGLRPRKQGEKPSDKGYKKKEALRAKAAEIITAWQGHVAGAALEGVPRPTPEAVNGKAGPGGAVRFTYRGEDWAWDWTLDIDDDCLETQTRKSTMGRLQEATIRQIIETHIFGGASASRVAPVVKKEGGSGHISVDAGTAFGGSVNAFLDFLLVVQRQAEAWKTRMHSDDVAGGHDGANSPWLADQRFDGGPALTAFENEVRAIRAEADAGDLDIAGASARLNAFYKNAKLVNHHPDLNRVDPADRPGMRAAADHYQAVNLENMANPNADSQRLELRDVPAQTDFNRLIADLTFIQGKVAQARDRG